MANNGKRYNEEFKTDIIRLVQEDHQPVNKVAEDYGVNAQTIRNWMKSTQNKKIPGNNRLAEVEAQLREEKRKNAELEQTVNILKKSVAIVCPEETK